VYFVNAMKHNITLQTREKRIMTTTQRREEAITDEIHAAQRVLRGHAGKVPGMEAVITANTRPGGRREWFGFHFEPSGSVQVGDVLSRTDGTRQRVVAVMA